MSICDFDASEELDAPNRVKTLPSEDEVSNFFAAHVKTYEWTWRLFFEPLPIIPRLPRPFSIGVQHTSDPHYLCEGRFRFHIDLIYFCYTLSGVGGFKDKDKEYRTGPGKAFLLKISDPDISYFYPSEAKEDWKFLVCELGGESAISMAEGLLQHYGPIFNLDPEAAIIRRLLSLAGPPYAVTHPHPVDASELTVELLLSLAASARAQEQNDPVMDVVKRAMQIISNTPGADLNVEELARRVGVSRERLSRVFRARLNRSPHQLILEQKIHDACLLLKDTSMTVKEISAVVGYSDYTNFIRVFRSVMNMTPTQFRQHGSVVRFGRVGRL